MAARTKNFSQSETDELLRLAKKYQNYLECRKADRTSCNNKDAAWLKIEEEFNRHSDCVVYRDKFTLRTKYRNLKKELRRLNPDIVFGNGPRSKRKKPTKRQREPSPEVKSQRNTLEIGLDGDSSCSSDKIMRTEGLTLEKWTEIKYSKEIQIMEAEHAKRMKAMHAEHIKRMQIMQLEIQKLRMEKDLLSQKLGDPLRK